MTELSFVTFLERYVRALSFRNRGDKTGSIRELAAEVEDKPRPMGMRNCRLLEPLVLLSFLTDRMHLLEARVLEGGQLRKQIDLMATFHSKTELLKAVSEPDLRPSRVTREDVGLPAWMGEMVGDLPIDDGLSPGWCGRGRLRVEYLKVWESYLPTRDTWIYHLEEKAFLRGRILKAQEYSGEPISRMAREMGLNPSTVRSFLVDGDLSRIGINRLTTLMRHAEEVTDDGYHWVPKEANQLPWMLQAQVRPDLGLPSARESYPYRGDK